MEWKEKKEKKILIRQRDEFIKVIQYAETQPNVPYMSVKLTGYARFGLLEKLR